MIQKVHEVTTGSRLIGIHGRAGSGKDTICMYLHMKYKSVWREAFADPLKHAAAKAFGINVDEFNDPDMKEITNDFWNVSPRKITQFLGTEMFRNTIAGVIPDVGNDFWVRRLVGTLNGTLNACMHDEPVHYNAEDTVVITDVRFQNEVDWVHENGGWIVHVLRDDMRNSVGIPNHPSEQPVILNKGYAWMINNSSSKEDLYEAVDTFAQHIGLIRKDVDKFDPSNF